MARYLILNKNKPIRFFHDVCDDYDGKRERRRSFCLQKGHAMPVPYRMYKNTKAAIAFGNIKEVDAQTAIDYLKDCGAPKKQITQEIAESDMNVPAPAGTELQEQVIETPVEDVLPEPEDMIHESAPNIQEVVKSTKPRKVRRTRKVKNDE
jgi:hypothetical protein